QEAQRSAEQWAYDTFGNNRQILIAVHTDTDNIHVHIAVNAFSMDGKRWLDNKSTLKKCRENINKLCKAKHLSIIEHPKWNANQTYTEWLARKNGTSWKQKLCDDIDRIVLMENVKTIDHLVMQLCNCGYLVRKGKYLCVKPENSGKRQGVRTLKLGDGYGLEELKYRIENKDKEMSLDKVLSYTGVQREYAICLRLIQIGFYRKDDFFVNVTYNELRRSAELLCYIHEHNIHSKEDFENHVNSIAKKSDELVERRKAIEAKIKELEYIVKNGDKYIEMVGLYHKTVLAKYYDEYKNMKPCIENHIATREDIDNAAAELEKLRSELADMQGEYESAISEKKAVTAHYSTFIRQMETDYERCLRSGKKELEEYEANLSKPPKKQFSEVVEHMADWADKALEKVAEKERAEEQQRSEARKKRSGYCR
ncbi:MAG: relaxase/mobilization nuclease domain-containing protein, partial [Oscillospiraceae bacterium]|nr:relaxase/mobilization nuclease domain-containing protein [Oscillospiraceae bacterium]